MLIGAALLGILGAQPWALRVAAAQEIAAGGRSVYLPLVGTGSAAQPGQPQLPGQPQQPGQPQSKGAFFFNREAKNNSADVAVDGSGGMHAAYAYFTPDAEHPPEGVFAPDGVADEVHRVTDSVHRSGSSAPR